MSKEFTETVGSLLEWERKRKVTIARIIHGLRNDGPTTEPPSKLEERIGDLGGLVEFDATIQGIFQGFICNEADLARETDRCEALMTEYQLG